LPSDTVSTGITVRLAPGGCRQPGGKEVLGGVQIPVVPGATAGDHPGHVQVLDDDGAEPAPLGRPAPLPGSQGAVPDHPDASERAAQDGRLARVRERPARGRRSHARNLHKGVDMPTATLPRPEGQAFLARFR